MGLEIHFNASAWVAFTQWVTQEYQSLPDDVKARLADLNLPEDVRMAASVLLRGQAREWLHREIPALDHSRPIDLLGDATRSNAVRELLMRLPH